MLILPLLAYGFAAVLWLLARVTARRIGGYGIRLALFWAMLASSPVALLGGMVAGFIGPGVQMQVVLAAWCAVFLWFLLTGLIRGERAS